MGGPEIDEQPVGFDAERLADRAVRLGHGERRQLVLQLGKIAGQRRSDNVAAGRQKLAQLDVARPQRRQRFGEPLFAPLGFAAKRRAQPARQTNRRRCIGRVRQDVDAVPGERRSRACEPDKIDDSADHARLIAR